MHDTNMRREKAVRHVFLEFEKRNEVSVASLRGAARGELWRLSEGHVDPMDVTYVADAVSTQLKAKGIQVI